MMKDGLIMQIARGLMHTLKEGLLMHTLKEGLLQRVLGLYGEVLFESGGMVGIQLAM